MFSLISRQHLLLLTKINGLILRLLIIDVIFVCLD